MIFVVLISWPGQVFGAEFSADLILSGGGDKETGKVFIKGNLRRTEIMENGEVAAISITRPDKGVTWNLMPEEKMYMEIPHSGDDTEDFKSWESRAKMKLLGKETVNGYKCEKRRYESDDKSEGPVIVWYSPKLDYPVKVHVLAYGGEDEMIVEYKNIKSGNVSDGTFEVPSTYQKFSMPAGMPSIPGMGK
jgi:hypothetical protein